MAKTADYTKKAIDTYRNKFDMLQIRLPKETKLKDRIKEVYGKNLNAKIIELLENDLEQREKQDKKLVDIIQEDVKQIAKNIDDEVIAAGLPELDPAKKAEIKAKLDAQIAEYEAKKAEKSKDQNAPKKDSFADTLERYRKENNEGKLALNVRE